MVAVLALAGCGGEGESELVGSWAYVPPTNVPALGLKFDGDGMYKTLMVMASGGAAYYAQLETGTYRDLGQRFETTAQQSTCHDDTPFESIGYYFAGQNLVIEISGGAVSMVPIVGEPGPTGAAYLYGCFGPGPTFTQRALLPVGSP